MQNKRIRSKMLSIVGLYLLILLIPSLLPALFSLRAATFLNLYIALSILGVMFLIWYDRHSDQQLDLQTHQKTKLADILLYGFTGTLLLYATNFVGSLLIELLFGLPEASQNTQEILTMIQKAPLFILYGVVLAPIMEEIVFRKTLYGLGRKLINPLGAALMSSLLFGLAHNDNRFLIVYAGIGLTLCWLYHRTHSIYVTMFAHGLFNGITIVLSLLIL